MGRYTDIIIRCGDVTVLPSGKQKIIKPYSRASCITLGETTVSKSKKF